MIHALPALVAGTLLVAGSVAAFADLARERQPRVRPLDPQALGPLLWVVESADGRWFLNGEPVSGSRLPALLDAQPAEAEIRFLPAATLPVGQVARSLARLRALSRRPVGLATPESRP